MGKIELQYFNWSHLITLIYPVIIVLTLFFILRNKSEKTKTWTLFGVAIFNAVLFTAYKIVMSQTFPEFIILNKLPLHLCNINLILIPIALLTKSRLLYSYIYFIGALGALAGVMLFDSCFLGKGSFTFVIQAYFIYHSILFAMAILPICLKLYKPKMSDILRAFIVVLVLTCIMHGINTIFRATKWCTVAKYFYTYGMPDNPLLGWLQRLVPINLVYEFPLAIVLVPANFLMHLPFHDWKKTAQKVREKKEAKQLENKDVSVVVEEKTKNATKSKKQEIEETQTKKQKQPNGCFLLAKLIFISYIFLLRGII